MKVFFLIILLTVSAYSQAFEAVVVSVKDADTLSFKHSDGNVDNARMVGLDAPEVARSSKEIAQPFGDKCKQFLALLIEGKTVSIETSRRDLYGRNLARVLLNGLDVNLTIIQAGCGWLYYPNGINTNLRASYENAFQTAKNARIGLFSRSRYVTPTVWRKKRHFRRQPKKELKNKNESTKNINQL
jgi:endonuclease YncB( thermonuclease family)